MNTLDRATNKNDHSHDPQRRRAVADIRSETPAGFGSEQVAGFILECMAGFVGIRTQPPDYPYIWTFKLRVKLLNLQGRI